MQITAPGNLTVELTVEWNLTVRGGWEQTGELIKWTVMKDYGWLVWCLYSIWRGDPDPLNRIQCYKPLLPH